MKDELEEYERLEYRVLNSRAAKASVRKAPPEPPKEAKSAPEPEIHVHVELPEQKEAKEVVAAPAPRKWKFKHKYDQYNKLVETIATAE